MPTPAKGQENEGHGVTQNLPRPAAAAIFGLGLDQDAPNTPHRPQASTAPPAAN
eukprot:CAMPEP_0194588752 /NCGR_PEP_ID=MMETSP0292-20121207/20054_1 /TAXON_ID=39354 /ORGANISM="Heterosigma akashiwo, Strain CCMP2393" /LENGTH=53 /DNA_ID=CAMNT_0039445489 /DNA_START=139 /DNA_END=297 /DNA_ORIENTATION=-